MSAGVGSISPSGLWRTGSVTLFLSDGTEFGTHFGRLLSSVSACAYCDGSDGDDLGQGLGGTGGVGKFQVRVRAHRQRFQVRF
jgi:hypothetical protein